MTIFANVRFYYPNEHYVEAVILFDTAESFLDGVRLLSAFVEGIRVGTTINPIIMSVAEMPQSTINIFSFRQSQDLRAHLLKYGAIE